MIQGIDFLKLNWPYILLVVVAIIYFLSALATYRIDLAKLTPDKADDEKARLFKGRVQATVKFLKSLFRIGKQSDKKKSDDAGFINTMFVIGLFCGLVICAAVFKLLHKPSSSVGSSDKEKIVYVEVEKKQEAKKKTTQIKNYADGSSETQIVEESDTKIDSFLASRTKKEDKKLGVYLGGGVKANLLSKPFASGILTYDPYAISIQSDFAKDHRAAIHLGFRF